MKKSIFILMMFLLSVSQSFAVERVGTITAVQKKVTVLRQENDKETLLAKKGDGVFFLDTYLTGSDSKVKLLFKDDSLITLGEKSRIQITEKVYDSNENSKNTTLNLFSGTLRALVGKVVPGGASKFEIQTPTAVAAARGTYFIVWLSTIAGQTVTNVTSLEGEVEVTNNDPAIQGSVLLTANMYTVVEGHSLPSSPSVIPDALLNSVLEGSRVEDTTGRLILEEIQEVAPTEAVHRGLLQSIQPDERDRDRNESTPPPGPPASLDDNQAMTPVKVILRFP